MGKFSFTKLVLAGLITVGVLGCGGSAGLAQSTDISMEAMLATVKEVFHIADAQLEAFYEKFMSKLPESMQRLLQAA